MSLNNNNQKITFTKDDRGLTLARDTNDPNKILFTFPKIPTFDCFKVERLHRKQRLVAAFRLFSKYNFDKGAAGHLTYRDPEYPELFWVNPFGLHFSCIKSSGLVLVNHEGTLVYGNRTINVAAFVINSKVHSARPDAVAVCHSHSTYGKATPALAKILKPITHDLCFFYNDHEVFHGLKDIATDIEEGENVAQALGDKKALILQNHGILTVGKTIDEAAFWFISMEKAFQIQLIADSSGKIEGLPYNVATDVHNKLGTPDTG